MADAVKVSMDDYMKDFLPTLENFCSKSPLQPRIEFVPETGLIKLESKYKEIEPYTFTVNPLRNKKDVIKEIKGMLEKNYPIVFDLKQVPLSLEEIESLTTEGIPITEIMNKRNDVYLPRYKVLRVHNRYNEMDLYDFKTRTLLKIKVIIPLVVFLDKLFSSTREEITSFFKKDTRFLYAIKKDQ